MSDLLTHQRLQQRHILHTWAQRGAQCLHSLCFRRPRRVELVELVTALAVDMSHAVVSLVVLLVAVFARLVQRQRGKLADTRGDERAVDDAVALGVAVVAAAAAGVTVGGAAPCRGGGVWQAVGPRQSAREGVSLVPTGAAIAHIVFAIGTTGICGGCTCVSRLSYGQWA